MRQKMQDSGPEPFHQSAAEGQEQVLCPRVRPAPCGVSNPKGANRCWKCGCALPGNQVSFKHGAFARSDRPELAAIRAEAQTWVDQVRIEQRGGASDELPAVRDGAVANLGALEYTKRLLIEDLKVNGLHTRSKKGGPPRVRSSFPLLLQVLDRWLRYAQLVGLDDHRGRVSEMSLVEYLAQQDAEQTSPDQQPQQKEEEET